MNEAHHTPWPVQGARLGRETAAALHAVYPNPSDATVLRYLRGAGFALGNAMRRRGVALIETEIALDALGDAYAERLDQLQGADQ